MKTGSGGWGRAVGPIEQFWDDGRVPWWIWIVIVVVALALIALIVGLVVGRRRRVTLAPPAKPGEQPKRPAGGGYRAGGSISFSAGGSAPPTAKATAPSRETPQRAAPTPTSPQAPAPKPATPERTAPERGATETARPAAAPPAAPGSATRAPAPDAQAPAPASSEETTSQNYVIPETGGAPIEPPPIPAPAPIETPAEPTVEGTTEAEPAAPGAAEQIAPAAGRLSRLRGRLARSQSVFGRSLLGLLGAGDLDEDSWQDIEDTLLMADLGSAVALEITEALRRRVATDGVANEAAARSMLRSVLVDAVGTGADRSVRALAHDDRPAVVLVVGVNGTGKTTTTGKLARVLVADGHSVVLGAADTFRAAAADQLATWAQRSGSAIVRGVEGADPAAVAFDAVKKGIEAGADVVVIDTAGRLHTKTGLMDELGKVKRVVEKQAEVDEVLLVLDATTGQNGLAQAKVFGEVVDVTGIVLTKLDGTAKGGIVLAVQRELGVPVKLVGLGEGPDDLAPFEPEAFVDALLGD